MSSCFGSGDKDSKKDSESTSTAQTTQLKQNTKVYTIGLSPDEFKERFNKFSSENNLPFKVSDLTIEKGEAQDAFKVIFSDNLALNGTVNKKDGSLRDILIIGQPTKNAADNINIILAFGTAIVAVNPELTPDERGQLLKDCGLAGENLDFANLDKSAVRNNIKYHATFTEGIGFMFTISSVDDK